MATSQEELILLLKLKDEMSHGVSSMRSSLTGLGSTLLSVGSMATIGLGAVAVAAAGMVAVTGIKFSAMKEQSQIAFTTMLKSGETAKMFLDELQRFAAKTPFEFEDLTRGSRRLMAMGTAAKDVLPTLTIIGDAAAGLSAGKEGIDSMITALSQMGMAGKVSSQDMMQLTNVGVAGWRYLAEEAGVSVAVIRKRAEEGALDSTKAVQTILAGMNKDFGGMMDRQSQSFSGMVSTFKDTFKIISGDIMKPFFTEIAKGMKTLVDWIDTDQFKNGIANLTAMMQKAGASVITWFKATAMSIYEHRDEIVKAFFAIITTIDMFVIAFKHVFDIVLNNKATIIAAIAAIGVAIVLALGPVSLAVIAIIGIIALIGFMATDWKKTSEGMPDPMLQAMRDTARGMQGFMDFMSGFTNTIIDASNLAIRAFEGMSRAARIAFGTGQLLNPFTFMEGLRNIDTGMHGEFAIKPIPNVASIAGTRAVNAIDYEIESRKNLKAYYKSQGLNPDGSRPDYNVPVPEMSLQERLVALGGGSGGGGGAVSGGGGGGGKPKLPFTAADLQFIDDLLGRLPAVADSLNKIAPPPVIDAFVKAQKELAEGTISLTSAQRDQLHAVMEYDRQVKAYAGEREQLNRQLADLKDRMSDLDNAGKELSPEFIALAHQSDVLKTALEKVDFVEQLRLDPLKDKMNAVRGAIMETINAEEALAAKRRLDAQELIKQLWAASPNQSPESAARQIGIANKAVAESANMAALRAKGYTAEQAASLTNAGVLAKDAVIPQGSPGAEEVTVKVEVVASPDFAPKGAQ